MMRPLPIFCIVVRRSVMLFTAAPTLIATPVSEVPDPLMSRSMIRRSLTAALLRLRTPAMFVDVTMGSAPVPYAPIVIAPAALTVPAALDANVSPRQNRTRLVAVALAMICASKSLSVTWDDPVGAPVKFPEVDMQIVFVVENTVSGLVTVIDPLVMELSVPFQTIRNHV